MMFSQLSLGCMQITGDSPEENAIATIERAVELGVNHIETARCYGNSEERVGKALKKILKHTPREKLYITTKVGASKNVDDFKKNFDLSMKYLDLDYIDNLDFHGPGSLESLKPAMVKGGCLDYVRRLMDSGVVKHFGFSTHGYPSGVLDLVESDEFESINLHYYYFYRGLQHVVQAAHKRDMGVFIISPTNMGGRLHTPTESLSKATAPLHPMEFNHRWLLNQSEVHTLSFGPKNPAEVDSNMMAADYEGTCEKRKEFDSIASHVDKSYHAALPNEFCTTCNECLPCPANIDIPGLLNFNNMNTAFDMKAYASRRYSKVGSGGAWVKGVKGDQCTKCGDCLPRCPEKLDIPSILWKTHLSLENGKISKPMWDHEGDLTKVDLENR